MRTPERSVWRRSWAVMGDGRRPLRSRAPARRPALLALVPGRQRPDHVLRGQGEGPDGLVLAALDLHHDAGALLVLPGLVELDPAPGHDELVARNVGLAQRLLDGLGLRRSGPVDGLGQGEDGGEGARRVAGEVHAVAG